MTDPIEVLSEAQGLLRKVQHSLRHEVSRRILMDAESLIQSAQMLEVEQKQRDEPERRHD